MNTLREVLRTATQRLQQSGSDSARRDAELLLLHVLQRDAMWLYAHDDVAVTTDLQHAFEALVQRREQGEPVAHLLGQRGFWTLDLSVNRHTLIPRPETEMLVEFALEKLLANSVEAVLDLGTGSGAIALAVKRERPACAVTAVDASPDALAVAHANARRLQLSVEFVSGHWFAPLSGRRFHLIVSNPPYIEASAIDGLMPEVARFEPREALDGGPDGLAGGDDLFGGAAREAFIEDAGIARRDRKRRPLVRVCGTTDLAVSAVPGSAKTADDGLRRTNGRLCHSPIIAYNVIPAIENSL